MKSSSLTPELAKALSQTSDNELLAMLDNPDDWMPAVLEFARAELGRRSVSTSPEKKKVEQTITRFYRSQTITRFYRFNGCGTAILGKRDFRLDGTYVTTAWFTLCWLPIKPLESYRISSVCRSSFSIEEVLPIHIRQVICTYLFGLLYFACFIFVCCYCVPNDKVGMCYAVMLAPMVIPFAMRRYARYKVGLLQ